MLTLTTKLVSGHNSVCRMAKKKCERCHSDFSCGVTDGDKTPCWCTTLPLAQNIPSEFKDCLCAKCLNEFANTKTSPTFAQENNEDYYFDTNGLMVFSRHYHLKRGYCCGNGCRHCPY
ncbi:cysteine-rich CWC family protein [Pseudobdellovibrio sp. HCB154]|uniref:cysteine-rich CWC family protein n=1 Tax=Pseudobdellovibrio sp. HCB154 TaxID=3386277 RepID=UPI00391749E3